MNNRPAELFFEDFHLGQRFRSHGGWKITTQEIKEFGERYDPQPFHLDEKQVRILSLGALQRLAG